MAYLPREAAQALAAALTTCGGDMGPLFLAAKAVREASEGELAEVIPALGDLGTEAVTKLEFFAENGEITPGSVISRFGLPEHFREMNAEAQQGLNSVAVEIPVEARAFFHTLLPVTDGRYRNAGVEVKIDGLVPLGPQEGELVAHLGGVFSSGCSKEQIKALLAEQALDQQFMTMARQVKGFDYRGTILAKATYRAKEKLGL